MLAEFLIIEKSLEHADAIFVLGGSSVYVERTQKAGELFRRGVSDKILLTDDGERGGWSRTEKRNPPFVELARNELLKQGIPAENIEILQTQVTGTIYEAELLAEIAKTKNLKSVLLVTSAYHTRRALWICEKVVSEKNAGTEIGIAHAATGIQTPPPQVWWLSPRGWRLVGGEYLKSLVYWLFY